MKRVTLVLALLALPVVGAAQYPADGRYLGTATQAGSENGFPVWFEISTSDDSTTVQHGVEGQDPVTIGDQHLISDGFFLSFAGMHCPFVKTSALWEAYCSDDGGEPVFIVSFALTPEPKPSES